MDVEGYEYRVVQDVFADALRGEGLAFLPMQISFELHWYSYLVSNATGLNSETGLSAGDMQIFWMQLSDMGYVPVSRENNYVWGLAAEFTVVRAFC